MAVKVDRLMLWLGWVPRELVDLECQRADAQRNAARVLSDRLVAAEDAAKAANDLKPMLADFAALRDALADFAAASVTCSRCRRIPEGHFICKHHAGTLDALADIMVRSIKET